MGYRVLVVEDDPTLSELLCGKLLRAGNEVALALHQEDAYRLLEQARFDYALLDLRLPAHARDIDPSVAVGFAILTHIRDRFSATEFPVMVMTAFEESSQTAVRAFKAGANDYIRKPFEDSSESLDEKLESLARFIAAQKKTAPSTPALVDGRHRVAFKKGRVDINASIKVTGRLYDLLAVMRTQVLTMRVQGEEDEFPTVRVSAIAEPLNVEESSVRTLIRRFRKFVNQECQRLGMPIIGDQEIIRNTRNWKGYGLNCDTCCITWE